MDAYLIGGLYDELEKIAESEEEYSVRPGSWFTGQKVLTRANTGGSGKRGTRWGRIDPHLVVARGSGARKGALKGLGIGAGVGAGVGALLSAASKGTIPLGPIAAAATTAGGIWGVNVGMASGLGKAQKEFLARRGIKRTFGGLGRGRLTPAAARKYLTAKERAKAVK